MKLITTQVSLLLFSVTALIAGPITARTPTAAELVASGGEVVVYFAGETASLDSTLTLITPVTIGAFFPNHGTAVGTLLSLGTFAAGTVLRFRLDVSSGNSFFSGPASGNPDNTLHVAHAQWASDATIPVDGILVGFEDLPGGGDLDYDDNMFVFSNVRPAGVPEPSSFLLGAAGVGVLMLLRRRRARQV